MALTEIERELNNLRRLLSEARNWNWIDYCETDDDVPKDLVRLDVDIDIALEGTGFK